MFNVKSFNNFILIARIVFWVKYFQVKSDGDPAPDDTDGAVENQSKPEVPSSGGPDESEPAATEPTTEQLLEKTEEKSADTAPADTEVKPDAQKSAEVEATEKPSSQQKQPPQPPAAGSKSVSTLVFKNVKMSSVFYDCGIAYVSALQWKRY